MDVKKLQQDLLKLISRLCVENDDKVAKSSVKRALTFINSLKRHINDPVKYSGLNTTILDYIIKCDSQGDARLNNIYLVTLENAAKELGARRITDEARQAMLHQLQQNEQKLKREIDLHLLRQEELQIRIKTFQETKQKLDKAVNECRQCRQNMQLLTNEILKTRQRLQSLQSEMDEIPQMMRDVYRNKFEELEERFEGFGEVTLCEIEQIEERFEKLVYLNVQSQVEIENCRQILEADVEVVNLKIQKLEEMRRLLREI